MKKIWNLYTDILGRTIFHPQFIMLNFTYNGIKEAMKHVSVSKSLIDIGSGRPTYRKEIEPLVKKYVTVDKFGNPDIIADAQKLPFTKNSFDIALMFQLLEYLENPQLGIKETMRILKKDGVLVLSSPFMYPIHDGKLDRNRFTKTQIKYFLENTGFKIVKVEEQGGFFEFWIQNLLVFWFKSALKFPPLIIPAPVLVPLFNISALILKQFGGIFAASQDFPLNILVIAKKK